MAPHRRRTTVRRAARSAAPLLALLLCLGSCGSGVIDVGGDTGPVDAGADGPPADLPISDSEGPAPDYRWKSSNAQYAPINALAAADQLLYLSSDTGVYVLELASEANLRCAQHTEAKVQAAVSFNSDGQAAYFTRGAMQCLGAISADNCDYLWSLGAQQLNYFNCQTASNTRPAVLASGEIVVATVADGQGTAHIFGVSPAGVESWHHQLDNHAIYRSLAVGADGTLFVGTHTEGVGHFYRLAKAGVAYDAPEKLLDTALISAPPLVVDDGGQSTVVVGDLSGYLYGVDAVTGEQRWQVVLGGGMYSRPVAVGGEILVSVSLTGVFAISAGQQSWSQPIGTIHHSGIATDNDNTLYVGGATTCAGQGAGGCVYAIREGKLLWRFETDGIVNATPVVHGDDLIVGTENGTVYAIGLH